jgi:hypothetical protein
MILQERQECLNPIYHQIEGINRRRAFVSTKYILAHEQFDRTLSEADKREIEKYKAELDTIDTQVKPLYKKLRDIAIYRRDTWWNTKVSWLTHIPVRLV